MSLCSETKQDNFSFNFIVRKRLLRLKQSIKPKGNLCLLIFKYMVSRRKLTLRIPPFIFASLITNG